MKLWAVRIAGFTLGVIIGDLVAKAVCSKTEGTNA